MSHTIYPRNHNKLHIDRKLHSKGQFEKYSLHVKSAY